MRTTKKTAARLFFLLAICHSRKFFHLAVEDFNEIMSFPFGHCHSDRSRNFNNKFLSQT
ncbi:MAG: hypothetical protein ABIC82_00110 [bacterium]